MAWQHNLCAAGQGVLAPGTAGKSFGSVLGIMEHARTQAEASVEFMQDLGIEYFCLHDADFVSEAVNLQETSAALMRSRIIF